MTIFDQESEEVNDMIQGVATMTRKAKQALVDLTVTLKRHEDSQMGPPGRDVTSYESILADRALADAFDDIIFFEHEVARKQEIMRKFTKSVTATR
eukprot:gene2771-12648_t